MEGMKETPRFTIVIPVIHSTEDLDLCLASLEGLDYPKDAFRIALVDCGVVPGLAAFLSGRRPVRTLDLHMFSLPAGDRKARDLPFSEDRINEARNAAMESFPAPYYVFTEDDCSFTADWLHKIDASLNDSTGMLGGPDILPDHMDRFTHVVDAILNSRMGTAGLRDGGKKSSRQYYPHKENMVVPSAVLNVVGNFPEKNYFGGEMEMMDRIHKAGYRIEYMKDNPVFHRRTATLRNFLILTGYRAFEKVALLGDGNPFLKTLKYLVPAAAAFFIVLVALIPFVPFAGTLLFIVGFFYLALLTFTSVRWAVQKKSGAVGLGVFLVMPLYHLSIAAGVLYGTLRKAAT